jgi:hypothetical protein
VQPFDVANRATKDEPTSREGPYPSSLFAGILKEYFAFSPTQLLFTFLIFCKCGG